ncbi:hypothetical protein [Ruminiclostridium cellobioparum]|uniref:hypothetical protein n=1 Tax=Ruminiclostridium cellobioparum TaxID=29355 RepID=UPI0004891850|nr:hypothetical protein [Ruminiclostridium cellobioparum]
MKIFGRELTFNGYDVIHKGNLKNWNPILSNLDENGIPTLTTYRRGDGTIFMQIKFTDKVDGRYRKCIVTYYKQNGFVEKEYISDIP